MYSLHICKKIFHVFIKYNPPSKYCIIYLQISFIFKLHNFILTFIIINIVIYTLISQRITNINYKTNAKYKRIKKMYQVVKSGRKFKKALIF